MLEPRRKPGGSELKIRRAKARDATRMAELCGQLGYPTTEREMAVRLRRALRERNGVCFVAEVRGSGVVGWLHTGFAPMLEVPLSADVRGLVVDARARRRGAGGKLLRAAELWAKRRGCRFLRLRSNVVRKRAHQFYLACGFEHYKTQKAFRKAL